MTNPIVAVYAGDPLNPANISNNAEQVKISRWTTIILSFLHFSPDCAMMAFNNFPIMNVGEVMDWAKNWNEPLRQLLEGGTVRKLYVSFGGGEGVFDFTRLRDAYRFYGNTFTGTPVDYNLRALRKNFPAITGIDMDIEECWDEESFVAFCQLVVGLGYEISFGTYGEFDVRGTMCPFYINCLQKIEQSSWGKGAVKSFNLQSYWADGMGSPPTVWAEKIKEALPGFNTDRFITVGCEAKYFDNRWKGYCPNIVESTVEYYLGHSKGCVNGGFIWNFDFMLQYGGNPEACQESHWQSDYADAIWTAYQKTI